MHEYKVTYMPKLPQLRPPCVVITSLHQPLIQHQKYIVHCPKYIVTTNNISKKNKLANLPKLIG